MAAGGLRRQDGLESVKKTLQVAWVGPGFPMRCPLFQQRPDNINPTFAKQALDSLSKP